MSRLQRLLIGLFCAAVALWLVAPTLVIVPISFVPVGLAVWLWHWRVLSSEANAYGESEQGATVRRVYYYLMAAVGLALMASVGR